MAKKLENRDNKEILKNLLNRLHQGENPEKIKAEFKKIIKNLNPLEISQIESELVKEGMSRDELQTFCDVHLDVFRESIEKEEVDVPDWHPLAILMGEHRLLLNYADIFRKITNNLIETKIYDKNNKNFKKLNDILKNFKESQSHYLREENVLFPYLEKHGVTEPPAIMWMDHDKIREIEKNIFHLTDTLTNLDYAIFVKKINDLALSLSETLSNHFYKENKILFPTGLRVMQKQEWREIRKEFDKIGYCSFTPKPGKIGLPMKEESIVTKEKSESITLETGTLSFEEVEGIFNTLPIEITFVDKDDIVRYFIPSKEMVFLRTKAVIGNKVQRCHPQRSVDIVNKILDSFRKGERGLADFWLNFKGRFLYIRYLPVRNKEGVYLGCIEVTQDITEIKKLQGEKRLLDWT